MVSIPYIVLFLFIVSTVPAAFIHDPGPALECPATGEAGEAAETNAATTF